MSKNYVFDTVPTLTYRRSRFDLSHSVKTSMNMGTLYPIDVQEVVPGDTFKTKVNVLARLSSEFIRPIMDNLFLDVYSFFVPSRVLYNDFTSIFGENKENAWAVQETKSVPVIQGVVSSGTVADYMGIPIGSTTAQNVHHSDGTTGVSVLPFRAFAKIYDGYFRDENLIDPMLVQTGEANSEGFNDEDWSPSNYTGKLPKVAKFHDYFTSCLPAPQKGSSVSVGLGGTVPVSFSGGTNGSLVFPVLSAKGDSVSVGMFNRYGVRDVTFSEGVHPTSELFVSYISPSSSELYGTFGSLQGSNNLNRTIGLSGPNAGSADAFIRDFGSEPTLPVQLIAPENLVADLGASSSSFGNGPLSPLSASVDLSSVPSVTVNDLRLAFQTQKLLEKDARGGTRYVEYLASHFGVRVSDYTMRGMEYLGGRRVPLNVIQVAQTTGSGSEESPLGSLGAYSQTKGRSRWTKSFYEHGYVLTVACIRQFHTYQQGIDKMWARHDRLDFYDPVFANIGEQPVWQYQIYASPTSVSSAGTVFGYQEAWADMRVRHNRVSGQMRTGVTESLDVWHLADNYSSAPTLGQEFIEETPAYLDSRITIPSSSQDQFIVDFWFDCQKFAVMPVRSVPGLIDHH